MSAHPARTPARDRRMAARALVRAVRPVIESHLKRQGPQVLRATIEQLSGPVGTRSWQGRVHRFPNINVGDHNVTFSQSVVWYDMRVGLANGDTLVLVELAEDDFTAVAIESNQDPLAFTDQDVYNDLNSPT